MDPLPTAKYRLDRLIYFEAFHDVSSAIDREKQLKAGSRKKKLRLIEAQNCLGGSVRGLVLMPLSLDRHGWRRQPRDDKAEIKCAVLFCPGVAA